MTDKDRAIAESIIDRMEASPSQPAPPGERERPTREEMASLLRKASDLLWQHHNLKHHNSDSKMFDKTGSCKICKPSSIFVEIEAVLTSLKEGK